MDDQSMRGQLVVANPVLPDPNFDRTVVLILAHGDDGALGLVLNRPSETRLSAPLPQWESLAAAPSVVFVGGPVNHGAAICLARVPGGVSTRVLDDEGWTPVAGDVGTLDLDMDPDDVAGAVAGVRVFAGYSGWSPGQLESEIEAGGWWVVDSEPEDALSDEPGGLWRRVLRRQGGELALVAAYPNDPMMN